jgi:hypothetical protein
MDVYYNERVQVKLKKLEEIENSLINYEDECIKTKKELQNEIVHLVNKSNSLNNTLKYKYMQKQKLQAVFVKVCKEKKQQHNSLSNLFPSFTKLNPF